MISLNFGREPGVSSLEIPVQEDWKFTSAETANPNPVMLQAMTSAQARKFQNITSVIMARNGQLVYMHQLMTEYILAPSNPKTQLPE
jgi:hypothetical protein